MGNLVDERGRNVLNALAFGSAASWLRQLLEDSGTAIQAGSPVHAALQSIDRLMAFYDGQPIENPREAVSIVRQAASSAYLIKALHRASPFIGHQIRRKLHLFKGADLAFFRAGSQSSNRDEVWELLTAAWAAPIGSGLEMQEPEDVSFDYASRRWALTCKVFYSSSIHTQLEAIVKGAKQVEKADVHLGYVLVNVSNLLRHDNYCRSDGHVISGFRSAEEPNRILAREVESIINRLDTGSLRRRLKKNRQGAPRLKTRLVVFFGGSIAAVDARPMMLSCVRAIRPWEIDVGEDDLFRDLNKSIGGVYEHSFGPVRSRIESGELRP